MFGDENIIELKVDDSNIKRAGWHLPSSIFYMEDISAPTYRLAAASRTEDAMRGFKIIEMANEPGNRFDSISVKNYEVVKADIVLKKQKLFSM